MEQLEFNATQAINETCYGLIKQGYSLHDIYDGLGNVMDGIEPKHASKLKIDVDIDTSKVISKLKQLKESDYINTIIPAKGTTVVIQNLSGSTTHHALDN